jgi:D-alanine--D-alanine ligase
VRCSQISRRCLRVAFCCNTRNEKDEFQVEYDPPDTIEKVKTGIEYAGHEYLFVEGDETAYDSLRRLRPDLVLNRVEGVRGESRESHIPAFCEMLGIPYVGSGVMSTAICLDKPTTKKILEHHGVRTPSFQVFTSQSDPLQSGVNLPLILKPSHEGSSMGINWENVVFDEGSLRAKLEEMLGIYGQPILGERYIDGREFTTGLLGNYGPGEVPLFLPVLEVDFTRFPEGLGNILGQKAKTVFDHSDHYVCPADIPEGLRGRLEEESRKVFKALDIKDWVRLDWRMDGELYFLEANPLPGIDAVEEEDEYSFYPMIAMAAGMSYSGMITQLIEVALRRYGIE